MKSKCVNHDDEETKTIIHITQEQYESLCQTDQLKLKDIMRKLGGELNAKMRRNFYET